MPYVLLQDYFPELALKETRSFAIKEQHEHLPVGEYALLEMYCDEPGCDCRRVFFYVISSFHDELEAVIAYGWEPLEFYGKWVGINEQDVKLFFSFPFWIAVSRF